MMHLESHIHVTRAGSTSAGETGCRSTCENGFAVGHLRSFFAHAAVGFVERRCQDLLCVVMNVFAW